MGQMDVKIGVLPYGGPSARLLPESSAVPNALMPIYAGEHTRPLVAHVVDECARAGLEKIIFITSSEDDNDALQRYFQTFPDRLREQLEATGKLGEIHAEEERREQF